MRTVNAEDVLSIPMRFKSQDVARRGFMSNLLFPKLIFLRDGGEILMELISLLK